MTTVNSSSTTEKGPGWMNRIFRNPFPALVSSALIFFAVNIAEKSLSIGPVLATILRWSQVQAAIDLSFGVMSMITAWWLLVRWAKKKSQS